MNKLTRIHQEPRPQARDTLLQCLLTAFADSGQRMPDPDDLKRMVVAIDDDMVRSFKNLTLNEMRFLIHKGIRGEYGDFTGLSVANIYKWAKVYYNGPDRVEYLSKFRKDQKQLTERTGLSEGEKFDISKSSAIKKYHKFSKTGIIDDWGNPTYDFLDSLGIIPFTNTVKKEIYAIAEKRIMEEKKMDATLKGTPRAVRDAMGFIDRIKKGLEKSPVVSESKRIALARYFSQLKEMDEDLGLIIDDAVQNSTPDD